MWGLRPKKIWKYEYEASRVDCSSRPLRNEWITLSHVSGGTWTGIPQSCCENRHIVRRTASIFSVVGQFANSPKGREAIRTTTQRSSPEDLVPQHGNKFVARKNCWLCCIYSRYWVTGSAWPNALQQPCLVHCLPSLSRLLHQQRKVWLCCLLMTL